jgi:hypothetical protein
MSLINNVTLKDSTQLDAFGRLKVSQPEPLFDNMFEYGLNTMLWETSLTNGTASHVANNCALRLSTNGTTSGNTAIVQTRKYMRYQPGRSLNIELTFAMGTVQTNSYARLGYFDASNGIFFERTKDASTTTYNIVRRTNVTGTPADNAVAQTAWNVDKMDGTGVSGKNLDFTKTQIMFIQLQFLGVGRVQVGFVVDGIPYVAHQFLNANSLSTVYMSSGCLPVRAQVTNSGTSGGTLTMDVFCCSVSSGGIGQEQVQYAISNGITSVSTSTTLQPILSIRAGTLLGGTGGGGSLTNRGHIEPISFELSVTDRVHEFQILRNATLGSGTSWASVGTGSLADYDVSSTTVTGGTSVARGYIAASNTTRGTTTEEFKINPLVYTGFSSQDILTIAARTTTLTGTALASLDWREQY